MTVSSASFQSSVAGEFEQSAARPNSLMSSSHAQDFSKMLNEGLKRNKEDHAKPAASHAKSRKGDESDNSKTSNATNNADVRQRDKPGLSGKIQILSKDERTDQPTADKTPSKIGTENSEVAASDISLSSTGLNKDAGSILMALMIQSRGGGVAVPQQADNSSSDVEPEDKSSQPSPDAAMANSAVPVAAPFTIANFNPAASGQDVAGVGRTSSPVESAPPSGDDESKAAAAAAPGHLAFALRLNAALNSSTPPASPAVETAAATPAAITMVPPAISFNSSELDGQSEKKEHSGSHSDNANSPAFSDVSAAASAPATDQTFSRNETLAAAPPPEVDDRLHEYSNDPVRNVHMQVVGEDKTRVDIRLIDRAGELRVSVKSADSSLNQTLQEKMPELTSRLESARYQTEVWMPSSVQKDSSAGRNGTNSMGTNNSSPSRPSWVDALEGSTSQSTERIN